MNKIRGSRSENLRNLDQQLFPKSFIYWSSQGEEVQKKSWQKTHQRILELLRFIMEKLGMTQHQLVMIMGGTGVTYFANWVKGIRISRAALLDLEQFLSLPAGSVLECVEGRLPPQQMFDRRTSDLFQVSQLKADRTSLDVTFCGLGQKSTTLDVPIEMSIRLAEDLVYITQLLAETMPKLEALLKSEEVGGYMPPDSKRKALSMDQYWLIVEKYLQLTDVFNDQFTCFMKKIAKGNTREERVRNWVESEMTSVILHSQKR